MNHCCWMLWNQHEVSIGKCSATRMAVRDLDFSVEVIGAEVTRESDDMAMSSRNVHLSPEERGKSSPSIYRWVTLISFNHFQALPINKSLLRAKPVAGDGEVDCEKLRNVVIQSITDVGGRIDYAEVRCKISSFTDAVLGSHS
ncbi:hypothetical protein VNO78_07940 [Psophocarpus tetragonolobus]|uniref:Uncharacterized protein n=1 Tax=Psophocarpus tetragonolobus TaxID=3891 RepID=A0AAN9T429_PSOTE